MAESSRRKVRRIKKDIISELPGTVHEKILGLLPVQDAVRTSILSKGWTRKWTMIPNLIFNDQFLDIMKDKLIAYQDPELKALKFVGVINKVLLLHNGPIVNFTLRFLEGCDSFIIHDYIDQWIPVLSRNNIKQLTLEDSKFGEFTAHHFSSLDLTHLRLIRFWFPYKSASGGFTYLTNLELIKVTISKQCIFDCPMLEKLTLVTCNGLSHSNFHAPNLKSLYQMCVLISLAGFENLGHENLTEFYCSLFCEFEPSETSNLVKVVRSLHRTEKICIAMEFIRYLAAGGSPNKLSEPLLYLKTIDISDMNFLELDLISCLLCLVRSAPNLCKLNISAKEYIDSFMYDDFLENYRIEDFEGFSIDQLELVTFSNFRGFRAELELVKFLLAHAPLLKTISIHRSVHVSKDVALMIAEEMLQYARASSKAQIRNLKQPIAVNVFETFRDYYV